jgi:hypothetical protein
MNDQGYYLPFWHRLLIRSTYVLLCTIVACVMVSCWGAGAGLRCGGGCLRLLLHFKFS